MIMMMMKKKKKNKMVRLWMVVGDVSSPFEIIKHDTVQLAWGQ